MQPALKQWGIREKTIIVITKAIKQCKKRLKENVPSDIQIKKKNAYN